MLQSSSTRFTTISILTLALALLLASSLCHAFVVAPQHRVSTPTSSSTTTVAHVFGKKGPKEDLSFIESRDMTREEMLELNKQNEEIMNMELQMMTGFSLILSLPILYLCWVAFFSD